MNGKLRASARLAGALALAVVFLTLAARNGAAEDAAVRVERFDGMIESLNAPSEQRARALEMIYNELRGPDSREMQQMLRETLGRSNSLILQGVVEAMAMLGDAADVGSLEALLATSSKLEVKNLVIRLLPAFCLGGSERARFNYITYAVGYERAPSPSVLEPLRRPPLTRRGRLNQAQERMQNRVVRILAGQFDPVGAALPYINDLLYSQTARAAILHYVGNSLGNDPGRWPGIWAAQGRDMDYLNPDEIEEIRLSALQSLSDMGAEGLPEVVDAFARLLSAEGDVLRQAAYETMGVMCRTGFDSYVPLSSMNFSADDMLEAENWRHRRFASTTRLAVFATERAVADLGRADDSAVFAAATACMADALSYPLDFPDVGGVLAAARRMGLSELERLLMMPDLTLQKRMAVAVALGKIGSSAAVSAIMSMLGSPYTSPEFGPDGMRMAEAAVEALRLTATGGQEGRDEARRAILSLLADTRQYAPVRAGTPPVGLAHMVLWRLQRLARSTDAGFDAESWRQRLGW